MRCRRGTLVGVYNAATKTAQLYVNGTLAGTAANVTSWGAANAFSVEHLVDYPVQYNHALVINFNTHPAVPGRGAGIFLHDLGPQAGPALPASVMTEIIRWIDPAQHPVIAIH